MRQSLARQGVANLEAVELGLREALFKDGRRLLEQLFDQPGLQMPDNGRRPGEKCHPDRAKDIDTLFGGIRLKTGRNYFYDPATNTGRFPLDQALGLVHSFSPALVRLAARAAAKEGYAGASEDLLAQAGVNLEGRQIHRLVNLSAPAVAAQLVQGAKTDPAPISANQYTMLRLKRPVLNRPEKSGRFNPPFIRVKAAQYASIRRASN